MPVVNNKPRYRFIKTYFTYSDKVSKETLDGVREAIFETKKRATKNKQFFDNLYINLCYEWDDLKEQTEASKIGNRPKEDNTLGYTFINAIWDNKPRELNIQTKDIFSGFLGLFTREFPVGTNQTTVIHEMGHQFDLYFGPRDKQLEKKYRYANGNSPKQIKHNQDIIMTLRKTTGLSNCESFKNAWRQDMEDIAKIVKNSDFTEEEMNELLGYYSPSNSPDINIYDGINEKEMFEGGLNREEIFAQLFAYALGYDKDCTTDGENLKVLFPRMYHQVKFFIQTRLGIDMGIKLDIMPINGASPAVCSLIKIQQ